MCEEFLNFYYFLMNDCIIHLKVYNILKTHDFYTLRGDDYMNKSKERAYEILQYYVKGLSQFSFVKSVVLVGSLSDNTYTGNQGSEIDLVHIVEKIDYYHAKSLIEAYISKVEKETNNDIPISKVVYSMNALQHPYSYDYTISEENKCLIEKPIEILRIKDSGKTI